MSNMNPFTLTFAVVFLLAASMTLTTWIKHHYASRERDLQFTSKEEEFRIDELLAQAEKMERRIESLEAILDKDMPDWRSRP